MNFYNCKSCGKIYAKPLNQCEYCGSSICFSCNKITNNICGGCLNKIN